MQSAGPWRLLGTPYRPLLEKFRAAGEAEFSQGTIPAVKINWFKVYRLCAQAIGEIDGSRVGEPEVLADQEWPRTVECIWEFLSFDDALSSLTARKASKARIGERFYELAKSVILEHFGGDKLTPSDVMWDF